MTRDSLERRLQKAAAERIRAEARRHDTARLLRTLVRIAAKAGWSKTHIAEVAGISRQTVHEMLRGD